MDRRTVPALVVAGMIITGIGGCRAADRSAEATDLSGDASAVATPPGPSTPDLVSPGQGTLPSSTSDPGTSATATPGTGLLADLTPDTEGLRLGHPVNGIRHGELVVTIRNNGPAPVQ